MKGCILKSDANSSMFYEEEIKKIDSQILALKLARPALRALVNALIFTVKDLRKKSLSELSSLHGLGPNAIIKLESLMR